MLGSLHNLQRWSTVMSHGCAVVAAVFIIVTAHQWITMDELHLRLLLDVPQVHITPSRRLASLLLALIPTVINAWGLMRLRRSFVGFATGELFTPEAITRLREFAAASTIAALTAIFTVPIISLVVTFGVDGGLELAVRIGTGSLTILLVSGVVWIFAHVLALAIVMERQNRSLLEENGKLASENAQFV
jgi:hypothetical protein